MILIFTNEKNPLKENRRFTTTGPVFRTDWLWLGLTGPTPFWRRHVGPFWAGADALSFGGWRVEGGRCWHVADVYVLNFEDHFLVDFFWLTYVDIDTVGISWVIPARRSSICWWNSLGCDAVLDRAHCPAIMGWCFSRSLLKFYLQLAIWLALVGSKQGFFFG